jgi:methionyl-tRNA formyltransferase
MAEQTSMNNKVPKVIFMGTPEFAVASLDALLHANINIIAVITAPDKPAGRGMKMNESAVKKFAAEKGLLILQPEKLKNPDFLESLRSLNADLQIVVAFRMLPELVWDMPAMGTLNLHGSLLPQYRGAAPINWAIINGEKETGVTTFKLQHEIDTGNILLQEKIPIGENETAGELHDKMKTIGAQLLVKTVNGLIDGSINEMSQQSALENNVNRILLHAPKISTETCQLDLKNDVASVYNRVRGLSPYPGAFTTLHGKMLKIFKAEKEIVAYTLVPGSIQTDQKTFLKFACADGFLHVSDLQLEGKKRMPVADFLRGYRIENASAANS